MVFLVSCKRVKVDSKFSNEDNEYLAVINSIDSNKAYKDLELLFGIYDYNTFKIARETLKYSSPELIDYFKGVNTEYSVYAYSSIVYIKNISVDYSSLKESIQRYSAEIQVTNGNVNRDYLVIIEYDNEQIENIKVG